MHCSLQDDAELCT